MANGTPDVTPTVTPTPDQTQLVAPAAPAIGNTPASTGSVPTPSAPASPSTPASSSGWNNFKQGLSSVNPTYAASENGDIVRTNPPVRGKGGILGAILGGALQAASAAVSAQAPRGAMGRGAAVSAGAQAAHERKVAQDDRARQIAQLDLQNQQAIKQAKMRNGLIAVQTAQVTQQMQHDNAEFAEKMKESGIKDESDQQMLIKNRQDLSDNIGAALAWMQANGGPKPVDTITHETGAAHQLHGQAVPHAKAILQNKVTTFPNGQIGKDNGMLVFSVDDLNKPIPLGTPNLILPEYTGTINSNGSLPTSEKVIQPDGKFTYGDLLGILHGQMGVQLQLQQQWASKVGTQSKANLENAQANLANEEAKNMKNSGLNLPQGFTTPANAFTMPQTDLQQTLAAQGVPIPSDFAQLYAIAHYQGDLKDYPNRVTKGTGQKSESQAAAQIRTLINPNFNEATYSGIKKQVDEYASSRLGTAGGNIIAFNTATAHLGKMAEAAKALQNHDVKAWNYIANQYGLQTGASPKTVFDTIQQALVGEVGKVYEGGKPDVGTVKRLNDTFNSSASPDQLLNFARTTAQLMQSKNSQLAAQYYSWTGQLNPNAINPETVTTYKQLGLDPYAGLPQGATASLGATGNMHPSQPQPFVPAKTQPPRPAGVPANAVYGTRDNQTGWVY